MRNINKFLPGLLILVCWLSCQPQPYRQGQTLYEFHCANCHMDDGKGLAKLIPALDVSPVFKQDPMVLICLIRNGLPVNPSTGQQMPANKQLSTVELTNLINYLRSQYTTEFRAVQVAEVEKWLSGCQ